MSARAYINRGLQICKNFFFWRFWGGEGSSAPGRAPRQYATGRVYFVVLYIYTLTIPCCSCKAHRMFFGGGNNMRKKVSSPMNNIFELSQSY